jgi:hypothetical protein
MVYVYKMSLGRQFFEILPLNNVSQFSYSQGQDKIKFTIPSQPNRLLDPRELVLSGTLQVNINGTTPLTDSAAQLVSLDSIASVQAVIEKIEVNNMSMNVMLDQTINYDLKAKVNTASAYSISDIAVGEPAVLQCCSPVSIGTGVKLCRPNFANSGYEFAIKMMNGLFHDNALPIQLDAVGGLEITIYLNSDKNVLMNVDSTIEQNLSSSSFYTLQDVKLFGRYTLATPQLQKQIGGALPFKSYSVNLQNVQSSNDTISWRPRVASLDNVLTVFQPNEFSRNNFDADSQSTDDLIGMRQYQHAKNGMPFPIDYPILQEPALSDLPTTVNPDYINVGSSEQIYQLLRVIKLRTDNVHILIDPTTEARRALDVNEGTNYTTAYLSGLGCSFQHGFSGYTSSAIQDLIQLQLESEVKMSAPYPIPQALNNQVYNAYNFINYNAILQYGNMSIVK